MSDYYVFTSGNDTTGDGSHATPWRTIKKATDTVAAGTHRIFCENVTLEAPTTTTTYFLAAGVGLYSTSDTTNDPPTSLAAGAASISATSGVSISVRSTAGYVNGMTFSSGTGGGGGVVGVGNNASDAIDFENCTFKVGTSASSGRVTVAGVSSATPGRGVVRTKNCTFIFGATTQGFTVYGRWESTGDTFAGSGSVPVTLIANGTGPSLIDIVGGNLATCTGTLVSGSSSQGVPTFRFIDCKLATSYTPLGSTTADDSAEVFIINSAGAASDPATNYGNFAHYSHRGNTVANFSIYQTTGASYDGTNYYSWVVTGTNATFDRPYYSPWFGTWHVGTSAITPRIECLRDGSTTAYTDAQVWGEWRYHGTSGYPLGLTISDKCGMVATPANQGSSALGAGDWTGETTPWYGKLEPTATITPVEKGHLSARVCVGAAIAVYVTPKLFGLS